MAGYLLDTNHLSALFNEAPSVIAKVRALPEKHYLYASAISLGEIEAGHRINETTNQAKRNAFIRFINTDFTPHVREITASTRYTYAQIMAGIHQNHPRPAKRSTERHLVALGVDINDVWIASNALEHKLTLVTSDRMEVIREVMTGLNVENWS